MPTAVNTVKAVKWSTVPSVHRLLQVKTGWTGGDFSTPLTYYHFNGEGFNTAQRDSNGSYVAVEPSPPNSHFPDYTSSKWTPLKNRAYSRLENRVNGEKAALGVFAAEWRESLNLVAQRGIGLWSAYRDFRRGRFRSGLRKLSVSPKRKHRGKLRNSADEAAGLWLEYWFGWSPMVSDIQTAVSELASPLPQNASYYGSASDTLIVSVPQSNVNSFGYSGQIDVRFSTGAQFSLDNPNTYLANQLGLLNPATVAWELIPFSFLADWAFDVSSFLESFSDFAGLTVSKSWNNILWRSTASTKWPKASPEIRTRCDVFQRNLGLIRPLPNTEVRANVGPSVTRAASAMSLLVKILKV
jgi:hypothetical protein